MCLKNIRIGERKNIARLIKPKKKIIKINNNVKLDVEIGSFSAPKTQTSSPVSFKIIGSEDEPTTVNPAIKKEKFYSILTSLRVKIQEKMKFFWFINIIPIYF